MPSKKTPKERGYVVLTVSGPASAALSKWQEVYSLPSPSSTIARVCADLEAAQNQPAGLDADYVLSVLRSCGATPEFIAKVGKRL